MLKLEFQGDFYKEEYELRARYLLKLFFGNFNFKTTLFTKIISEFWQVGNAMQSIQGHLYSGRIANFVRIWNAWVAEGVTFDIKNFKCLGLDKGHFYDLGNWRITV